MKNLPIVFLLASMLWVMSACRNTGKDGEEGGADDGKMLKFKQYTYVDKEGAGIDAFSFLMPSDWQFEGDLRWILDNPAMPSVTEFRVFNPKGKDEFEVFPNHCYFWTTNTMLKGMFPPGSKYFGSTVKQPLSARAALKNLIIEQHRGSMADLKITVDEDLPALAQALTAGNDGDATGAKVRVSYTRDGIPMEEEFYAVVENLTFPVQGMFGTTYNTIWYVDYIFSFKGEQGKLEESTQQFQTITSSFRINPKWFAKYSHMIEYLAQQEIRKIHSVGEFSRMLSRMSDQMSDEKMQQFESRNNVYDRVSENFSDHIRGVDKYYDPFEERQIDLPSGYGHAWCNNNGEYIVTDNPNLNPNVGSNLTWKPMDPK